MNPSEPFDLEDLEILTFGRSSGDMYPEQHNVALADVSTFRKSIGGSPTNVAVAAARLGRKAAVINRVGDDAFGAYVRQGLREFGVHDEFAKTLSNVGTKRVVSDSVDDSGFATEPRSRDCDVGGTATDRFAEGGNVSKGNIVLLGIHVDR